MKKSFITIILSFIIIAICAQQTDNYDLDNFSIMSPVQSSITSAKGWSMQDNGKWASADNLIPFTNSRANASRPAGLNELGQENFISLELRKIMIDDVQYNILIKKYRDGEFEFPFLQKGWKGYNSIDFYVFKGDKLKEFLPEDVPFNIMYLVDLKCYVSSTIKNYEKTVFMGAKLTLANYASGVISNFQDAKSGYESVIIKAIQDKKLGKNINDANLLFAVYPIRAEGKEVVRFKFIKTYMNENLIKIQTSPDNWRDLFKEYFYEVDYNVFNSFIRVSQSYYVELDKATTVYDSHYNWGLLRYQIGDYTGALEAFNKALVENPKTDDFLVYAYRGNTKSKMGLHREAVADFDMALSMRPKRILDYPNWVRNYFNRGVAKYYLNNGAGACEDWKKAYDLGYGSASEYLNDFCGLKISK